MLTRHFGSMWGGSPVATQRMLPLMLLDCSVPAVVSAPASAVGRLHVHLLRYSVRALGLYRLTSVKQ
jgi:hypothetical protein